MVKRTTTAPKKKWGGRWFPQGSFFVAIFVIGGQKIASNSPAFLSCKTLAAFCLLFLFLMGCSENEDEGEVIKESPNSFIMHLEDQVWKPYQTDSCNATYGCWWASLGDQPFYTIKAFYDEYGVADYRSENQLRIQIMNVNEPGLFPITGSYQADFEPYVLFVDKTGVDGEENGKRYINSIEHASFFVFVEERLSAGGYINTGIKGSFYGTLYNEDDPSDSIVIKKGKFHFEVLNLLGEHCIHL